MDGQLLPVARRTVGTIESVSYRSKKYEGDAKLEKRVEMVVALTQSGQRGRHFLARCISVSRWCEASDVERPSGRPMYQPMHCEPISSQRLSSSNLLLDHRGGRDPSASYLSSSRFPPLASLSDPTNFFPAPFDPSPNFSLLQVFFFSVFLSFFSLKCFFKLFEFRFGFFLFFSSRFFTLFKFFSKFFPPRVLSNLFPFLVSDFFCCFFKLFLRISLRIFFLF